MAGLGDTSSVLRLLSAQTLEEASDDLAYGRKVLVEILGRGVFRQAFFQNAPKVIRDGHKFAMRQDEGERGVCNREVSPHIDLILAKGGNGNIEVVSKTNVNVADFKFALLAVTPLCEGFEQGFDRHEEFGDCRFNCGSLPMFVRSRSAETRIED